MSLRIAVDLDGVLADMQSELARQAELLFGDALTRRYLARKVAAGVDGPDEAPSLEDGLPSLEYLELTTREQRRLWRQVESIENFWETLKELEPGGLRRLATIAAERRWEVIFLTTRPKTAGRTAQLQTQRWLTANGFGLPAVFVVRGSRGRIASALDLDFVVDDRPDNCLDVVVDSKSRAILVWRDDEKQLPPESRRIGIGVVQSFTECLDILQEIDAPISEGRTLFDRVKKMLGFNESAGV